MKILFKIWKHSFKKLQELRIHIRNRTDCKNRKWDMTTIKMKKHDVPKMWLLQEKKIMFINNQEE